jgi:hypothetical protein
MTANSSSDIARFARFASPAALFAAELRCSGAMSCLAQIVRDGHAKIRQAMRVALVCRDSSSHDRHHAEGNSKDDGDAEEHLINASPGLEDGTSAAKDATESGATRLEQNRDRQGDAQNDLNDLDIL